MKPLENMVAIATPLIALLTLLMNTGGLALGDAQVATAQRPGPQGGSKADALTAPSGVAAVQAIGGYLYVLRDDAAGNQIYGFHVGALTGALTLLPAFPIPTGGNGSGLTVAEHMAYDAANSRLYVVNAGSNTVSAYSVNPVTGALTALLFSSISLGSGAWVCLAVHPSGSPLVVGNSSVNPRLASFNITSSSATPVMGSPFTTDAAWPASCAFSRDGTYVYTGGDRGNYIAGFSVNASTGVLTALPGSPFDSGAPYPCAYVTDSAGRLFIANLSANQVRVFTTSSGVPAGVISNPFTSGLIQGVHGVQHPAGFYMVADRGGNQVGVYRIAGSGASTTLTNVSGWPFAAGGTATHILALSETGAFLFAANAASRNITTFAVDASTGLLTNFGTQPAGTMGSSGRITGMVSVPRGYIYLPVVIRN